MLTSNSFSTINSEVSRHFAGQPFICNVSAYISKDKWRNYLHLSIANKNKELNYIFIMYGGFYQCVSW